MYCIFQSLVGKLGSFGVTGDSSPQLKGFDAAAEGDPHRTLVILCWTYIIYHI